MFRLAFSWIGFLGKQTQMMFIYAHMYLLQKYLRSVNYEHGIVLHDGHRPFPQGNAI